MRFLQIIKQRWSARTSLTEIADETADRCIEAVWRRVRHQVVTLAPSEARGYIRARGVAIVQPQLASATTRYDVLEHLRPQLYALTVEAVIQRVQRRARDEAGHRQIRHAA